MITSDKCPNCGAPIRVDPFGSFNCKYCGSQKVGITQLQLNEAGCMTVTGYQKFSEDILRQMSPDEREQIIMSMKQNIAHNLAEYLCDKLAYFIGYDLDGPSIDIHGYLRIKPYDLEAKKRYDKNFQERIKTMFS